MREITDPKTGAIIMQPDATDLQIREMDTKIVQLTNKIDMLANEISGLRKVIEILVECVTHHED